MKNVGYLFALIFITLLFYTCSPSKVDILENTHGEEGYFLETPDTSWRQELFPFPIRFAQDINHDGVEDARFPVGWEVRDSSTFWSYVFAWKINRATALSKSELEADLQLYFNGLMGKEDSSATLNQKQDSRYTGQVKTYDSFFDKKPMTLNVIIKQKYCEEDQSLIVFFQFSPRGFNDTVWKKLDEVEVGIHTCKF